MQSHYWRNTKGGTSASRHCQLLLQHHNDPTMLCPNPIKQYPFSALDRPFGSLTKSYCASIHLLKIPLLSLLCLLKGDHHSIFITVNYRKLLKKNSSSCWPLCTCSNSADSCTSCWLEEVTMLIYLILLVSFSFK